MFVCREHPAQAIQSRADSSRDLRLLAPFALKTTRLTRHKGDQRVLIGADHLHRISK